MMSKHFNDASLCKELTIFECGKEECVSSKAIALTAKPYHLFHYVYHGKGTFILNGKKYEIAKGTIFYIPTNMDAVYYPDKDDPWSYEWVCFNGSLASGCLEELGINVDNPIITDNNKSYRNFFDRLAYRYVSNGQNDLYTLGCLYELFGEMLYDKYGKEEVPTNKVTIQLAKDFIWNNYQFDISIIDVAKNAHVTPNYLSAVFQKEEGMTTKTFLIKVRMEMALVFLRTGQFKIKEVSEMVGYSNQLHFSNEFKRFYGKSPSEYKDIK